MMNRRDVLKLSASMAVLPIARPALAQARYPSGNVKVVVPYPAGGTTDAVARVLANGLQQRLGQAFVIENRPGVSGALGSAAVAKSAPDGLTLLVNNASFPLNAMVMETAGRPLFNFPGDFVSIANLIKVPVMLLAHPSVAARDLKQYVEMLKAQPALKHNYGSTGAGSFLHLVFEILKQETGVNIDQVAYRGSAPMIQDLITNQIQIAGDQLPTSIGHIQNNSLKALATTASSRAAALPDVPTVAELGLGAIEIDSWNGLFAPAGTPREIVAVLQREVRAIIEEPAVRERLVGMGAEPSPSDGAELDAAISAQIKRFRAVIERLKINPGG